MKKVIIVSQRAGALPVPAGYTLIVADRSTLLGNPFVMRTERQRDAVCDKYDRHLKGVMTTTGPRHAKLRNLVIQLGERVVAGEHLALACWCAPRRCHLESVRRWVLRASRKAAEVSQI